MWRDRRKIHGDWWVRTPAKINVWPGDLQSILAERENRPDPALVPTDTP
jgi:hypothetical protein